MYSIAISVRNRKKIAMHFIFLEKFSIFAVHFIFRNYDRAQLGDEQDLAIGVCRLYGCRPYTSLTEPRLHRPCVSASAGGRHQGGMAQLGEGCKAAQGACIGTEQL